ncbi:MAG: sulfur carrier protein ThiS [Prosthecobacter sp.]|jgi:sulfur carrier protein
MPSALAFALWAALNTRRPSSKHMQITLNGEKRTLDAPLTIRGLLDTLGLGGKPVVVEQNQAALLPRELDTAGVSDGDVIEVVQITAGG